MNSYCFIRTKYFALAILSLLALHANAQLSIGGQLRTRTELRDGQGTLTAEGVDPALFTSQRTRFTLGYSGYRLRLYSAVQDVRVWGQDASTINRTTTEGRNGIMVHEAWAEVALVDTGSVIDNFSLKFGRQELLYDDSRLLGNLDWLQQARRHDIALLKFAEQNWQADAGFAFNQNSERTSGNIYNGMPADGTYAAGTNAIGVMYKTMQFLYLNRKFKPGYCSFLLLKDDFNKYHMDTTSRVWDRGTWSRITTGFNFSGNLSKQFSMFASAFVQNGKNKDGKKLSAWFASVNLTYKLSDRFSITAGSDWLSGNDGTKASTTDRRFDPLYGTPHKFWGYMDYFYVASPAGGSGLEDYYIKFRFKPADKLTLNLDLHEFYAANTVSNESGGVQNSRLGTELDFVTSYTLTKDIGIEGAYCIMIATGTMASAQVKNVANADMNAHWAYLMLNVKTDLFRSSK